MPREQTLKRSWVQNPPGAGLFFLLLLYSFLTSWRECPKSGPSSWCISSLYYIGGEKKISSCAAGGETSLICTEWNLKNIVFFSSATSRPRSTGRSGVPRRSLGLRVGGGGRSWIWRRGSAGRARSGSRRSAGSWNRRKFVQPGGGRWWKTGRGNRWSRLVGLFFNSDLIFSQNLIASGCWSKLLKASRLWMSGSQIDWSLAFTVIVSSGSTLFGGTDSLLILKKLPDSAQVFYLSSAPRKNPKVKSPFGKKSFF